MARHFSRKLKRAAYARCCDERGIPHCEACSARVYAAGIVYDHVLPWEISRDSSLDNCQVLCLTCDRAKTALDQGDIAHARAVADRHIGAMAARRPMPGGRRSKWKRKIGAWRPEPRLTGAQLHARAIAARYGAGASDASA